MSDMSQPPVWPQPPTAATIPIDEDGPRSPQKRVIHRKKAAKRTWSPERRAQYEALKGAAPQPQFKPDPGQRAEAPREMTEDDAPLTRVSREDRDIKRFAIPLHRIKPGWTVEWKTTRVLGEVVSSSVRMDEHHAGWRPEKAKDWPELSVPGTPPDAAVEQDGQILVGRPMQFTMKAQQEDYAAATRQLADRAQSAQEGRLDRRGSDPGAGLADMARAVQPIPMGVSIEGEVGSTVPVRR